MTARREPMPLEEYFADSEPASRELFEALCAMVEGLGETQMRVTKSQVAWYRQHAFAWAWWPKKYLGDRDYLAPLVLTLDLHRHDRSPRWKQVVEVRPSRYTHHLELRTAGELDNQVTEWLREAWDLAG